MEGPEQAFAYALTAGSEAWIGFEWNAAEGEYQWSDNWPVWYTKWGQGYPTGGELCVNLKENKNVQDAEWVQSDCNEKKVSDN